MANAINLTLTIDRLLKLYFSYAGLKSTTTDLGDGDGTIVHTWVPKTTTPSKPNLLLIHGFGGNAMWQFFSFISPLLSNFNLYIPDLVFFGDSYTTRPDRSEAFQAQCVMSTMARLGVAKMHVAGISYGGFVGYSIAAQYPEAVGRVVVCSAGVSLDVSDYVSGMYTITTVAETVDIFVAQTPEKMRELIQMAFYWPPMFLPDFILSDFIDAMNKKNAQQVREVIEILLTDRKLSYLAKITQPTLLIWGENDQIFPVELAHRLQSYLGGSSELVILKEAGHAISLEKPRELRQLLISFLV